MILRDDAAAAWFSARGLECSSALEVSVDEREVSGLRLMRTWHGAASGMMETPPGVVLFVLQLDSEIVVTSSQENVEKDKQYVISAGDSFALVHGQRATMETRGASARIEIEAPAEGELIALDSSSFPSAIWTRDRQEWPHAALVSLTNVVLNLDPATPLVEPSRLAVAVRACLETFVAHSDAPAALGTGSKAQLLVRRARATLERRAVDPEFTVDGLAAELDVTRAYLWRVFTSELSITPRDALRAVRRQAAADFLREHRASGERVDMAALARRTGFGSHDALRRALKASDLQMP